MELGGLWIKWSYEVNGFIFVKTHRQALIYKNKYKIRGEEAARKPITGEVILK